MIPNIRFFPFILLAASLWSFFLNGLAKEMNESVFFTLNVQPPLPIIIEKASSVEQQTWGLMKRTSLPSNQGMLFSHPEPTHISLWSFNCCMDFGVAFLDKNQIIKEMTKLKAYPEMMDPKRPVNNLSDFSLYPFNDPIFVFFFQKRLISKTLCCHAFETNASFFSTNAVSVGDVLIWNDTDKNGKILYTQNITPYLQEDRAFTLLQLTSAAPLSVRALDMNKKFMLYFYDEHGKLLQKKILQSSLSIVPEENEIVYCEDNVSRLIISPLN